MISVSRSPVCIASHFASDAGRSRPHLMLHFRPLPGSRPASPNMKERQWLSVLRWEVPVGCLGSVRVAEVRQDTPEDDREGNEEEVASSTRGAPRSPARRAAVRACSGRTSSRRSRPWSARARATLGRAALRLAADAVPVPVEAMRVRVGNVIADNEVVVRDFVAVEVWWRRRNADRWVARGAGRPR
jgi:hypothetical protein